MDTKEMLKEPEEYIPKKTFYCYTYTDGKREVCPFWEYKEDLPIQENGYCHYLGKSDYELNEEYNRMPTTIWGRDEGTMENITIEEFFGSAHFPSSLLWDMCKECGINDEIDESDLA